MKYSFNILLIFGAIALIIYTLQAVILSETHKLKYGKGSFMAWIPILNFYILGKVAINKLFGLLLIIYIFLISNTTINNVKMDFIPSNIKDIMISALPYILGILYIIAMIRYVILVKNGGIQKDNAIVLSKKKLKIPANPNNTP